MTGNKGEICRLCAEVTEEQNFNMSVKDDCGGVEFQKCIEYYCQLSLGELEINLLHSIKARIQSISF